MPGTAEGPGSGSRAGHSSGWGTKHAPTTTGGVKRPPPGVAAGQLVGKSYEDFRAECIAQKKLFEDPDFPAVNSSIFYSKNPPKPFEWKRPKVGLYLFLCLGVTFLCV